LKHERNYDVYRNYELLNISKNFNNLISMGNIDMSYKFNNEGNYNHVHLNKLRIVPKIKQSCGLILPFRGILLLLAVIAITITTAQVGAAAIITVDDSGGADFTMIQDAIDAASPGDTIEVYSGTYYENVNVTKQLTLQGVDTGMGQPVVDAGESGSGITLLADGIALENFEVINSGYYWRDAGITVISSNNAISDNNVSANLNGISLLNSSSNTISGNIASNNLRYGIHLAYSSNNILINNHMFENSYNFGLEGQNDKDFDNDIDTSNTVDGKNIYFLLNASDTIIDSASNAGTVYCINCDSIIVKDLNLTHNGCGIYFFKTNNSISQNNSLLNNEKGIFIEYSRI
jgi:parallel beta-helix repeat protein